MLLSNSCIKLRQKFEWIVWNTWNVLNLTQIFQLAVFSHTERTGLHNSRDKRIPNSIRAFSDSQSRFIVWIEIYPATVECGGSVRNNVISSMISNRYAAMHGRVAGEFRRFSFNWRLWVQNNLGNFKFHLRNFIW